MRRKGGSKPLSLDPNSAAAFASSSTASFPTEPMCLATQVSEISNSWWSPASKVHRFVDSSPCSLSMSFLISSIRYWADCA